MKTTIKTTGTVCNTNGKGFWTGQKRAVGIKHIELNYVNDEKDYGHVLAFFRAHDWNTERHSLIYTDPKFLADFRKFCNSIGLPGRDVDYTEMGAQGNTYVSLGVGKKFIKAWEKATGQEVEADYYGGQRD